MTIESGEIARDDSGRRGPAGPPVSAVLVPLDTSSPVPLQQQVARGVRDAILRGALAPGTRIPSSRLLARDLGISRTTVLLAYEALAAEGYLVGARASGTYVARVLPESLLTVGLRAAAASPTVQAFASLSRRGRSLAFSSAAPTTRLGASPRAFRMGPDTERFPIDRWTRIAARWDRRLSLPLLDFEEPEGLPRLRAAIARHLSLARGIACSPERVLVLPESQVALDLVARLLFDPGDAAWIEDPACRCSRLSFELAGVDLVPIPVDADGFSANAARDRRADVRGAYVFPSHPFGGGGPMSLSRRLELLAVAREKDMIIVEDDVDSEFTFFGRPLPALAALDEDGRVVYVGRLARSIFPSLRLVFLVVPEALARPFADALRASSPWAAPLDQAILSDFMSEGHFARHVRRMRTLYHRRHRALREALAEVGDTRLSVRPTTGGLQVAAHLPRSLPDVGVAVAAARLGVETAPLSYFSIQPEPERPNGLLLGFGAVPEERLLPAVRTLQLALDEPRADAGPSGFEFLEDVDVIVGG